jgi:uncharacterized membrane protein YdjX (TVP38/TMEM64 family)/rhodanese-related sulfurtransferase
MKLQRLLPRLAIAIVLAVTASWLALHRDQLDLLALQARARELGLFTPVTHVVLFAMGTILFVPGSLFGLAGGALFGPVLGTLLNLLAASLGATIAFLIARYLAEDRVRQVLDRGRLERLLAEVEAEAWRSVAFVRLVPIFPFNLLNYALGLTRIPLGSYVLASVISMLPGTFAYTWLGYAGRQALARNDAALSYGVLGLSLLAAITFLPRLLKSLRSKAGAWTDATTLARRRAQTNDDTLVIDVREPDEFAGALGHIQNARNIPIGQLSAALEPLHTLLDKPIVLVCHTDMRSQKAAALLGSSGFRHVSVLRGGMVGWTKAGLPVAGPSFTRQPLHSG